MLHALLLFDWRAVAGACIGGAQQGQHEIAHIHSQLQPLHVPGTCGRSQILYHTYARKGSWHCYKELTAGTKLIYAHTFATAIITCPTDTQPQGVALSEFFVLHDFTPLFCPAKVHLVEVHAVCCSNECCKKDVFQRVYSSGACSRSLLRDLTNHRQQKNDNTILSCLSTCDKHTIGKFFFFCCL